MENYQSYIPKVLKEINENVSVGSDAKNNINNILNILLLKLVKQSTELMRPKNFVKPQKKLTRKKTLSITEMETAVILVMSGSELEKHALHEGKKCVTRFNDSSITGTGAEKAGLKLSVSKTANSIRNNLAKDERLSSTASVYTTAVLEYILAEIVELSANACEFDKKKIITPVHIKQAIENDPELNKLIKFLNVSLMGQ